MRPSADLDEIHARLLREVEEQAERMMRGLNALGSQGDVEADDEFEYDEGDAEPRYYSVVGRRVALSCDGRCSVVGESYYQPALKLAASGRSAIGLEHAIPVLCALVPEPSNPYDSNAVRIDVILDERAVKVGYLSRHIAPKYQHLLLTLGDHVLATCPGRILGGGSRYYGIHLHIAEPETLLAANSCPIGMFLSPDRMVAVTGEERHHDVLMPLVEGRAGIFRVFASIHPCAVDRGKYAGRQTLEARIDGKRVGQVTYAMGQRYLPLLAGHESAVCEALVMRDDERGPQVILRLPPGS